MKMHSRMYSIESMMREKVVKFSSNSTHEESLKPFKNGEQFYNFVDLGKHDIFSSNANTNDLANNL